MKHLRIVLAILVLASIAGVYYTLEVQGREQTDDAQFEAYIVPVSARVTGYVKKLDVRDNETVREGQTLLTIDPTDYQIAVDSAKAALAAAEAQYDAAMQNLAVTKVSAPSGLAAAEAAVTAAKADLARAIKDAARNRRLKNVSATERQIDQTNTAEKVAAANLEAAEARLKSAETSPETIAASDAQTRMLLAEVNGRKAALAAAEQNLSYTQIVAPLDGKITARTVEPGMLVEPGQALLSVSNPQLWVVANFKETQLADMRVGQPVKIDVDAYPGLRLTGRVDSIQAGTGARLSLFPPENATGNFVKVVQRVPVKIVLDNPPPADLSVAPGMSVEVTVRVDGGTVGK
ncbi:MAG: HlyD family secretion protein [Alphaproteobacteria bacterium]|nr:HlyD family secretion protein [Alphaproteobacteria bacterium]